VVIYREVVIYIFLWNRSNIHHQRHILKLNIEGSQASDRERNRVGRVLS
jgi:hypothetical protein